MAGCLCLSLFAVSPFLPDFLGQHRERKLLGILRSEQPRDLVFHLAHIARPRVGLKRTEGLLGKAEGFIPLHPVHPFEVFPQERDVFDPFPQRTQADGDSLEPVIEIRPKLALAHQLVQGKLARHDEPEIGMDALATSQPLHVVIFTCPEKLGLSRQGQLRDFVQKESPPVSLLKEACLPVHRTRIRALFIPEQLRILHRRGDGSAVYRDKPSRFSTLGSEMKTSGDDFLSGARLAFEVNVVRPVPDPDDDSPGLLGRGRTTDELRNRRPLRALGKLSQIPPHF